MNLAPVKRSESARGLAHSTTLSRGRGVPHGALASWTAPVLWRFPLRFREAKREISLRRIFSPVRRGEGEDRETPQVITKRWLLTAKTNVFPLPIGWGEGRVRDSFD